MEVVCTKCHARYLFDASEIPPGGYDARCTHCGAVFFVAPEQPQVAAAPMPSTPARAAEPRTPEEAAAHTQPEWTQAQAAESQNTRQESAQPRATQSQATRATQAQATRATQPPIEQPRATEPQPTQRPTPQPAAEPLLSVACKHCGAVYQFAASAIPAGGYDAQCTQCQRIFFVSPAASAVVEPELLTRPRAQPGASAREPAEPSAAPTTPVRSQEPVVLGRPKQPAPWRTEPSDDEPPVAADLVALSAELGEPAPCPEGVTLEDDFERIMRRQRRRLILLGVVAVLLAAYTAGTYVAAPRLFDLTVGKVVGIKLTVDPAAVPLVEKARTRMLDDTDAAYEEAIGLLDRALAIDQQYPEALALAGLAHVFRGADIQARGREIYAAGARAVAEIEALEDLPASRRPHDLATRTVGLRAEAAKSSAESSKLFEAGGKEMSVGAELLKRALDLYQRVPVVAEAAGIYYTTDPDSVLRAAKLSRYATDLQLGTGATLDLRSPPDMWLPFLEGLVAAAQGTSAQQKARFALEAALAREPRFQRARFALVRLLDRAGEKSQARQLAEKIVASVPDHGKAKAYLGRDAEPTAAAAEQAPAPEPHEQKAKKRR